MSKKQGGIYFETQNISHILQRLANLKPYKLLLQNGLCDLCVHF